MTPVEKLRERMVGKIEAALITSDINRRYFTGMRSSAGTLVVFPDSAYLIIDFRYIEKQELLLLTVMLYCSKAAADFTDRSMSCAKSMGLKQYL